MCQYSQDQKFTNKEIDSFLLNQKDLEEISILRFFNNMHIACRNMHVAIEYIASSTYLWRSNIKRYLINHLISTMLSGQCFVFLFRRLTHFEKYLTHDSRQFTIFKEYLQICWARANLRCQYQDVQELLTKSVQYQEVSIVQ